MSVVLTPDDTREILARVGDATTKTADELDAIACDFALTLQELALLVDAHQPAIEVPRTITQKQLARGSRRIVPPAAAKAPASKACSKCSETKPLTEFFPNKDTKDGRASWCRVCNNKRERTPARMVEGRARGRAYRILAQRHPDEWAAIFADETRKAIDEQQRIQAEAEARGQADAAVARIKPGPKRAEQTDAIERLDVARCPSCSTHHDANHVCPSCETSTDVWKNQEQAS